MKTPVKFLADHAEWESLLANVSQTAGLVLFKQSPTCPISFRAEDEFDRWHEALPDDANLQCIKVNVIAQRPISQAIARETSVRHESPQVIWFNSDGQIHWHASHGSITQAALNEQR